MLSAGTTRSFSKMNAGKDTNYWVAVVCRMENVITVH